MYYYPSCFQPIELDLLLQPGETHVNLKSNQPPIRPSTHDSIFLRFSIKKFSNKRKIERRKNLVP